MCLERGGGGGGQGPGAVPAQGGQGQHLPRGVREARANGGEQPRDGHRNERLVPLQSLG